jgi:hypothetical protein
VHVCGVCACVVVAAREQQLLCDTNASLAIPLLLMLMLAGSCSVS